MKRIMRWWRRRQRALDKKILFEAFRQSSRDREMYWRMIFFHVLRDPAWKHRDEWKSEEPGLYEHIVFLDKVLE